MYGAEFGGKASALINVVTRSGSNTVRGSLFGFGRDDALDAPNYFQPAGQEPPPLRQNQFGGTLGGPLVRNRTFVFGSFEGLRMQRSLTRTFSVPSAAVRLGDFGGLGTICDPLAIPTGGTCTPFAANRIPADRIDPIAAGLLERQVRAASGASTLPKAACSRISSSGAMQPSTTALPCCFRVTSANRWRSGFACMCCAPRSP
jgi:hypothetical protein